MSTIYFLEAAVPLVKGYTLNAQNEIKSNSYPNVANFKSHKAQCNSIKDFYAQLVAHAKLGHCLIKGKLNKTLNWQSRAGSTTSNDNTDFVCFDLDGAPFDTPEEFMSGHALLKDLTYIVQYSASHGLGQPGLRCHIFVLLNKQYNVSYLKSWLMELNLDGNLWAGKVRRAITLSNSKGALHWPIDITACQNDKLLYIAPAVVGRGVPYKAPNPAIQLVPKRQPCIDVDDLSNQAIEVWKKEGRAVLNALRKEAGLETVRPTRVIGTREVQGKPGEANITEMWEDTENGFMRFNLNGGNSNAYYHPIGDFEYIDNFKGEPSYLTKEIAPGYYADCKAKVKHESTQPTEKGEIILGVCDKRSAAMWKVSWNQATANLQLYPANNVTQLNDWSMQHGKTPNEFTPQWDFEFNPKNTTIVDVDKQYLNTYVPSKYYRDYKATKATSIDKCPTIKKIIMSMVSNNEWTDLTEHLMNWLAVAMQHKIKIGTTWVLSGVEGTGKNLFANHIMRPLIGNRYVKEVLITGLEDQFNGWLEHCMLCFVNEIQVSSSQHRKIISGKLKNWITDSPLDIRNMGRTRYDAENYCNFIMNSNESNPVDINKHDRRYNLGDYQNKKLVITEREVKVLLPKELDAFFEYLMTRKADIEQARVILETQTRKDVIQSGRNSLDMLADALLEGDISPFVEALPDIGLLTSYTGSDNRSALAVAYHTIITRELYLLTRTKVFKNNSVNVQSKLTRDELLVLFEYCVGGISPSPSKFTRMLKHKNIVTKRMRGETGLTYGIDVTWMSSREWCEEHAQTSTQLRRVK